MFANVATRLSAVAVVAAASLSTLSAERPLPTTWWALVNSVNSEDLGLVKELRSMKWYDACFQWGKGLQAGKTSRRLSAIQLMLDSDKLLNDKDKTFVPTRQVEVGMTTCGVFAVLGRPDDNNTTTTATVTSSQLVYRRASTYVYTDAPPNQGNGVVRAIQR